MPKSKNNRKKKKISTTNNYKKQQYPQKSSLVEDSPNSELLTKLIKQADASKLFLFTKTLLENAKIQFSPDEKEWFEKFDKLLSSDTDFFMNFLFTIYFKEESPIYCDHLANSADILSIWVNQDYSEKFKNEVLNLTHFPIGLLGCSESEELEMRIQWYTTNKLIFILDLVKAIYTSTFLESVYKLIEVERKLAEF